MKNKVQEKPKGKIIRNFILIICLGMMMGFFVGLGIGITDKMADKEQLITAVKSAVLEGMPYCLIVTGALGIIVPLVSYLGCKAMYDRVLANEDDDELFDSLEERLNRPLIECNIFSILNLCLLYCNFHTLLVHIFQGEKIGHPEVMLAAFLISIVAMVANIAIQNKIVNMEKKLNPEKRGNVLDFKFRKVWLDSCDEAQKLIVYKAGYQAYLSTHVACMVALGAGFIIIEIFKLDIFSIFLVGIIMGVNTITYAVTAARLEKGK